MIKKLSNSAFIKFLFIGGLNTAFGYLSFCGFTFLLGNAYTSVILATISGVLFNFKTYGTLVFNSKDNSRILRFFAAYLLLIGIQMVLLKWLNLWGITNPYLAVAIMILPMSALSFIILRKFVFHSSLIPEPSESPEKTDT